MSSRQSLCVICILLAATGWASIASSAESNLPKFAEEVSVQQGGVDSTLAEAVQVAAADSQLAEYRALRLRHGATADGQLSLARWCRSRDLESEARLHWRILLTLDPGHPEALKRLGLKRYQGRLLKADEIVIAKQEGKLYRKAAKSWEPKLKRIRRLLQRGDEQEREAAAKELVSIQDPLAIPSIREVFAEPSPETLGYLIEVFAEMPDGKGVEFLVEQAVLSDDPEVRRDAAYRLSRRPYHDYVPKLMAGLAAPIELSAQVSKESGRAITETRRGYEYTGRTSPFIRHRIRLSGNYSASDVAAWGREVREVRGTVVTGFTPDQYRLKYRLVRDSPDPDAPFEAAGEFHTDDSSVLDSQQTLERRIEQLNAAAARRNQRIHEALVAATGKDPLAKQFNAADPNNAAADPRPWWEWWRKQRKLNNYVSQGMEVWTQTGPRPIEEILIGDRVLTRSADTGALTFNLVVGFDVQPQQEMRAIEIDDRTILATPEQAFHTTHAGTQEAADLKAGSSLESLAGPIKVSDAGLGPAITTYSLVIEDSSNFFVDRLGIQIADATPNAAK